MDTVRAAELLAELGKVTWWKLAHTCYRDGHYADSERFGRIAVLLEQDRAEVTGR